MRTYTACVIALAASLVHSSPAAAQMQWTDKAVVSVNGGLQIGSGTFTSSSTYELYEETGTLTGTQKAGTTGLFDIGLGYKVWRNLLVTLGYSYSSGSSTADIIATVPDPLVYDRHRTVTTTMDAGRVENSVHIGAMWMIPITDTSEVGIFGGPTVFMVTQDVPGSLTVSEPGPIVQNLTTAELDATAVGLNLGVDFTYLFTPRVGAGLLARYTWGTTDLDGATDSLTLGGFQLAGGVRIRF